MASQPTKQEKRIRADNLKAVARKIFAVAGSNARECDLLADHLIEANLEGHDSHGIGMIPAYIASLSVNELVLNANRSLYRKPDPHWWWKAGPVLVKPSPMTRWNSGLIVL